MPMRFAPFLVLPLLATLPVTDASDAGCGAVFDYGPLLGAVNYSYQVDCHEPWEDYLVYVDDTVSPLPCYEVELRENNTLLVRLWAFQASSTLGDSCATTSGTVIVHNG